MSERLSRRAEQERTLHKAEMVVESAKRKHGAAMLVGKAMADIGPGWPG